MTSSRWISAARYAALAEQGAASGRELLTRIRVPLEEWDYSIYRKLRQVDDAGSGSMTSLILTKIQKDILTDIRVVLALSGSAAVSVLREKSAESFLNGKQLPLNERDTEHFLTLWRTHLSEIEQMSPMQKDMATLCIESGIKHFID
jgi:CO/xanthine dehydrogenase FAD-binding subunit